jgi:hypothetical protein
MGCQSTKDKNLSTDPKEYFLIRLKEGIDSGCHKKLNSLLQLNQKLEWITKDYMNTPTISYQNYLLSPLSYSVIKGKHLIFSYLISIGISFDLMQQQLEKQNIPVLEIIFAKGYRELLESYMPLYMAYKSKKGKLEDHTVASKKCSDTGYPVHAAARALMCNMIVYIHKYFKNSVPPPEFDLSSTEEPNGENCGLLACRYGCFPMLKILHEECKVDLKILNKCNENAVIICLKGYRKRKYYSYYTCIHYLIHTVNIDITYRYEDMLNLVVCPETQALLESELQNRGISFKSNNLKVAHVEDNSKDVIFSEIFNSLVETDKFRDSIDYYTFS